MQPGFLNNYSKLNGSLLWQAVHERAGFTGVLPLRYPVV